MAQSKEERPWAVRYSVSVDVWKLFKPESAHSACFICKDSTRSHLLFSEFLPWRHARVGGERNRSCSRVLVKSVDKRTFCVKHYRSVLKLQKLIMLHSSLNDKLNDHHVGPITTISSHLFFPRNWNSPEMCTAEDRGAIFHALSRLMDFGPDCFYFVKTRTS